MDNGASSYRRFLEGNDSGIAEMIRDYKDGLTLYLNGFVGNIHLADELTEDTFVKLAVKKPRFSGRSSFKTWLYAIGRNVALDHLKRRPKTVGTPIEDLQNHLADEHDLERTYLKEERKIELHRALGALNPEYRQILHLIYFEDFKNTEAATLMKKSNRQIENLIYRAKQSLKTQLEKEGFVYEEL